jgi:hypothetical protein
LLPKFQIVCLREILILEKAQVHLTSYRSLEIQNTQYKEFLFCRVITKIKGIIGKSPKRIQNIDITLYEMQI